MAYAAEILIIYNKSDAVDFLTKSLGMPYSVVPAQQACSTEMVNTFTFNHVYFCEATDSMQHRSTNAHVRSFEHILKVHF